MRRGTQERQTVAKVLKTTDLEKGLGLGQLGPVSAALRLLEAVHTMMGHW